MEKKTHPTYTIMIANAIGAQQSKNGAGYAYIKNYLECNYNINRKSPYILKTIKKLRNAPEGEPRIITKTPQSQLFFASPELLALIKCTDLHTDDPEPLVDPNLINRGKKWSVDEDNLLLSNLNSLKPDDCNLVEYVEIYNVFNQFASDHKRTKLAIKLRVLHHAHLHIVKWNLESPKTNDDTDEEKSNRKVMYIISLLENFYGVTYDDYMTYLQKNTRAIDRDVFLNLMIGTGKCESNQIDDITTALGETNKRPTFDS
jgi:hypothetical protein